MIELEKNEASKLGPNETSKFTELEKKQRYIQTRFDSFGKVHCSISKRQNDLDNFIPNSPKSR